MSNTNDKNFPPPNVIVPLAGTKHMTEDSVRGMICNPIYCGIDPYPQIIPDEQWILAAEEVIRREGVRQFLVNMLHCLKVTYHNEFNEQPPQDHHAKPEDHHD